MFTLFHIKPKHQISFIPFNNIPFYWYRHVVHMQTIVYGSHGYNSSRQLFFFFTSSSEREQHCLTTTLPRDAGDLQPRFTSIFHCRNYKGKICQKPEVNMREYREERNFFHNLRRHFTSWEKMELAF